MKPHDPKLEVKQKSCEESLGVLPWTSLGRCTSGMQAKGRVTVPRRSHCRRDVATGALGEAAAAIASSQMLSSSCYCREQWEALLTCFLHPLRAFWHCSCLHCLHIEARERCWESNSPVETPAFQKPTFSFPCSTSMGKNKPSALKTAEALKYWMDLLQPSWAPCTADPSLQAPLKEWEESHAAHTLWGFTTLHYRYYINSRWKGFIPPILCFSLKFNLALSYGRGKGGVTVAEGSTWCRITCCNCNCRDF